MTWDGRNLFIFSMQVAFLLTLSLTLTSHTFIVTFTLTLNPAQDLGRSIECARDDDAHGLPGFPRLSFPGELSVG